MLLFRSVGACAWSVASSWNKVTKRDGFLEITPTDASSRARSGQLSQDLGSALGENTGQKKQGPAPTANILLLAVPRGLPLCDLVCCQWLWPPEHANAELGPFLASEAEKALSSPNVV